MRLFVLASGSAGNCMVIEQEGCFVVVDSGLSYRCFRERLSAAGFCGGVPAGILLSHEHSDHSRGIGVLARKLGVPVYATPGTIEAMADVVGRGVDFVPARNGSWFEAGPFGVGPFSLPHDASDPSGYVIEAAGSRIGIATDLGSSGDLSRSALSGCDAVVLEFNHDEDMLWSGGYPWPLKQRIASATGHLSNAAAAELLGRVLHGNLRHVVLAHLSQENNTPGLALETARTVAGREMALAVGRPDRPLEAVEL
ncbi:MBL fold metallo-hydrolase [Candidatus Fermentibacterales bacterium]|nr:MBL fold metallo-hydrolase [Candidatus Fermentibacterales bacterium]